MKIKNWNEFNKVQEGETFQSTLPTKFEKLAKAIEDAGFKNTYTIEEIEVDGKTEDGNIFIDDEPLNFTILSNNDVVWNDFTGSKNVGSLEEPEQLVINLKKFLTK